MRATPKASHTRFAGEWGDMVKSRMRDEANSLGPGVGLRAGEDDDEDDDDDDDDNDDDDEEETDGKALLVRASGGPRRSRRGDL